MSYENEPKTVDDYKDVVKILKLKIIKQNKKIQQLQLKNKHYEEQINSVTLHGQDLQISSRAMLELENEANSKKEQRELELNTLKGKVDVMNVFVKGLKKLGITPQSVFRMADVGYKSFVESDYFREMLSRLKLGLNQKQISCLIFIFDEAYSGFITRQQYYSSLHAYKLGIEDDYHLYIHECIFKLSQMLHQDKVNLIKFYEQMQGRSKSKVGSTNKKMIDMNVFEEQVKKYYASKISQKEIVASFHAIDLESQGYLEKSNFLYTITSFINKLLTGEDVTKKTQNQWSNVRSQLTEPFQGASPTKKTDKVIDNYNSTSKVASQVNEGFNSEGCLGRLKKQYGVSLSRIYEQIAMYDFTHRLTLKSFKKLCWKASDKVSSQLLSELYKQIDNQFKGSIYFNELFNYYLLNSSDCEMILRLFGKYLAVSDLNSEKFWFMFGLNPESEISKNKFEEVMKKTFESKDGKPWEALWNAFSRDRDSCNVGTIIRAFQKYES